MTEPDSLSFVFRSLTPSGGFFFFELDSDEVLHRVGDDLDLFFFFFFCLFVPLPVAAGIVLVFA